MDTSYIISKMNEYMFRLNQQMGSWLEKKLPKITDDWWQDLVFNNLSPLQRESCSPSSRAGQKLVRDNKHLLY